PAPSIRWSPAVRAWGRDRTKRNRGTGPDQSNRTARAPAATTLEFKTMAMTYPEYGRAVFLTRLANVAVVPSPQTRRVDDGSRVFTLIRIRQVFLFADPIL